MNPSEPAPRRATEPSCFRRTHRSQPTAVVPVRRRALTPAIAGDTLASALLAAGVRLVGRSFKYHRPRGILTAGSEEPNALVELRSGARREPNTRATVAELFDGLEARSQNRWPSLALRRRRRQLALRADLRRRLLLQDLHVAGGAVGEALRAADPPRGRPRPREPRARSGHLREGARLLRCAGHRRRRRRSRRRTRRPPRPARASFCATRISCWADV